MPLKSKIAVAAIAVATSGVLATTAFAHKPNRPHPTPHNAPSIAERLGHKPGTAVTPTLSPNGTWTPLAHAFPGTGPGVPANTAGPDTALLLTDGSVIMHDICTPNWFRLVPDNTGSYINGTWSAFAFNDNANIAAMPSNYGPLFYASAVLPDTRVIVQGGEFERSANGCANAVESTLGFMYNPHANTWSAVPVPPGWTTIGDSGAIILGPNNITGAYSAASYMLSNGPDPSNVINRQSAVATIAPFPGTAISWTITSAGKADSNSEENPTLLPNGMVLTIDNSNGTNSELFDPAANSWSSAGTTAVSLVNNGGMAIVPESGGLVSIGFNMAVQFGANPNTAVFSFKGKNPNPPGSSWTAGPAFPANSEVADGPSALLPNGNILVQTSNFFSAPSLFWEFQSSALTPQNTVAPASIATATPPCGDPLLTNVAAFQGRMLVLPTGQILWSAGEGANCTSVYASNLAGNPNPIMRPPPHITSISNTTLTRGNTGFTLTGSIFKGVSQGASYGEDAQSATNFPLVRITNNASGHVCWGRTHDWAILTSTQFDVPPAVTPAADWALIENPCEPGASTLVVITNGLVSNAIAVTIQ